MPIYFSNEEPIDIKAIELMGVSIKEDGAIGYFGTGLKLAIATILLNECQISVMIDGEKFDFTSNPETIRSCLNNWGDWGKA